MSYVDGEGYGRLTRADRLKTAGAVFLAAAALFGLTRIDTKGATKYDAKTEAALQKVIQPKMVMAARRIIHFSKEYPYKSYTSVKEHVIEVDVSAPGVDPLSDTKYFVDLELATRRSGDSKKPDPRAATAVYIDSSDTFPGSRTKGSEGDVTLYAPGGANTLVGFRNSHVDGWSAESGGSIDLANVGPYLFDTSHSDEFVAGPDLGPSDPVTTAKSIVSRLGSKLGLIRLDLEAGSRRAD